LTPPKSATSFERRITERLVCMPIDFKKLNDPEFRAKVRAEEEARAAAERRIDQMVEALDLLTYDSQDEAPNPLSEKETQFVRSLRVKRMQFFPTSEKQLAWLESLHARYVDCVEGEAENVPAVQSQPRRRFNFGRG